jgi:fimbrial chaperone protein
VRHIWRRARRPGRRGALRLLATVIAGTALGVLSPTSRASAATFTVDPTQIFLSSRAGSVLLTLHNQSTETLSFQLSVFSWAQAPDGQMQLQPTQDIVFFPPLVTLKPTETRRVRVGATTTFDAREKTYRIFVEELPPTDSPTSGVRVLTKMGIPIFLRPAKEIATATLSDLRQQQGSFRFSLSNTGTVHIMPRSITVRALAGSTAAFERELEGWYVLANSRRDFELELPKAACAQVTSIVVDIRFEAGMVQERLQTPSGACPR